MSYKKNECHFNGNKRNIRLRNPHFSSHIVQINEIWFQIIFFDESLFLYLKHSTIKKIDVFTIIYKNFSSMSFFLSVSNKTIPIVYNIWHSFLSFNNSVILREKKIKFSCDKYYSSISIFWYLKNFTFQMKMFLQILLFKFEGSEDMMSKQYFPLCKVTMNAKKKWFRSLFLIHLVLVNLKVEDVPFFVCWTCWTCMWFELMVKNLAAC